jgi:hypothetical protein
MRIGHITHSYLPNVGGIENYIKFKVLRDFHERVRNFEVIKRSIINED